ncbi:hypothetical protein ABI_47620 [Asticcacaulis biprosthecium C19]|uniref:Uncharacterized protein n=1 Tax=Asticcacaulis biprosthecium C19 TaxID=715226 RepID=F4QUB4_9CAUL|nr:hypothetical protein [Asticcacaulis biprosthecium]EGF89414.1 hypothetical protein ABI_47620 [Asticcacaulis biprosthecium C19]
MLADYSDEILSWVETGAIKPEDARRCLMRTLPILYDGVIQPSLLARVIAYIERVLVLLEQGSITVSEAKEDTAALLGAAVEGDVDKLMALRSLIGSRVESAPHS